MATGTQHPTAKLYVKVAIILAIVTAIEVAFSYIEMPPLILLSALVLMGIVKFAAVVAYFMHLKFDNPMLRAPLLTGIFLAILIYSIVVINLVMT